jgi:hypothetical protein
MVVTTLEVVKNTSFIHLKMPTQLTKTVMEEDEHMMNNMSSRLNPRHLGFGKVQFSPSSSNFF